MADLIPTGRELEALKVLWARGKATVREVYHGLTENDGSRSPIRPCSACSRPWSRRDSSATRRSARRTSIFRGCGVIRRSGSWRPGSSMKSSTARWMNTSPVRSSSRRPSVAELEELERMIGEAKREAQQRDAKGGKS